MRPEIIKLNRNSLKQLSYKFALALLLTTASSTIIAANNFYVRLGLGTGWSNNTKFSDTNPNAKQPPAYYGNNINSKGDFGHPFLYDLGFGYKISPLFSTELILDYQSKYRYSGNANFVRSGINQPVSADASSVAVMATGLINLATLFNHETSAWQPFIGLGLGVSRNYIDDSVFKFPVLHNSTTTLSSADTTNFAYMLTAGINWVITPNTGLRLGYRFYDLGDIKTGSKMTVIGHGAGKTKPFTEQVGQTSAKLRIQALLLSIWYKF